MCCLSDRQEWTGTQKHPGTYWSRHKLLVSPVYLQSASIYNSLGFLDIHITSSGGHISQISLRQTWLIWFIYLTACINRIAVILKIEDAKHRDASWNQIVDIIIKLIESWDQWRFAPLPAACSALIAARDSHPFCMVFMGLKQTEEALEFLENCRHCLALPKKLWRRRHKVAPTQSMDFEQRTEIYHPRPNRVALWVWPKRGQT